MTGTVDLERLMARGWQGTDSAPLGDWLRARVLNQPAVQVPAFMYRAFRCTGTVSLLTHAFLMLLAWWLVPKVFAAQGFLLVELVMILSLLGTLRLAISPATFILQWQGLYMQNLSGQLVLFVVANLAVVAGWKMGGTAVIAVTYVALASVVYVMYAVWCVRALQQLETSALRSTKQYDGP